jgi:RNA recognition motif-containing protein
MSNHAEATNAIRALNGRDLDGRSINVNEARPRAERGSGFGQRGQGGGQRRGNRW